MSSQLLSTKFYIPSPRPNAVLRPRLTGHLNDGVLRKLTLISAPAGFGKSTLVREWASNCDRPVAWLSLDEEDSESGRFLAYLIAALRTVSGCAEAASAALQSRQLPSIESILTILLNEIAAFPEKILLVLDDYHLIDAKPVDEALGFFVEHLPPQIHLVIITREDPQLPLARLRARGQLTELRTADLRFTPAEASEFLNQTMGLDLQEQAVTALEARTEGWIAGLQMAALSLQGQMDNADFIEAFTGSHRFILDYLVEEVLQRQNAATRGFLLQTSILERLSGPLCDTVTGQKQSGKMLDALERGNLFVVPLDDRREWYRYHHLFAEVLQARLMQQPNQVAVLHRRASEWYEHNGQPADAIRHALAAEDYKRGAELIEQAWPAMRQTTPETVFLGWIMALPDERVRASPVLSTHYGFALLSGELDAADARLRDAEQWLEIAKDQPGRKKAKSAGMAVVNEAEFCSLPGILAIARAYHAGALGDLPGIVNHAGRALELLGGDEYVWRGSAAALLGLSHWASGDLQAARQAIAKSATAMRMCGDVSATICTTYLLADIHIAQGRLHEAVRLCEKALRLAAKYGKPAPQGTADIYVVLSELLFERNDLQAAEQQLQQSRELGEPALLPESRHRKHIVLARIRQAMGDMNGALEQLDEAQEARIDSPAPDTRPIAALKVRLWVQQGQLREALDWVRERGLSSDDELNYMHEFEHITLARILIAKYKQEGEKGSIHQATVLLSRLQKAAHDGERTGSVIEIQVLQALAHHAQNDLPAALKFLQQALLLAEEEDYIRLFVDEGQPMASLLQTLVKQGSASNYLNRLRAAFGESDDSRTATRQLSEPLSKRELDVLRLLGSELNGPEIAAKLFVSLNTLRTHTKHIYNKLGVNNRRAAVRRASEIGLLPTSA